MSRSGFGRTLAGAAVAALLAATPLAYGIINPKFTPVHLVVQSEVILCGAATPTSNAEEWIIENPTVLKGNAEGRQTLNLGSFKREEHEHARALMGKGESQVILFFCRTEAGQKAYVHVGGRWMAASSDGNGRWSLSGFDSGMDGTFAGGTDMLVRMARYILADPDSADVPVSAGTAWSDWIEVCKVTGGVSGLAAVQVDGRTCLFIGSPGGDRLYRPLPAEGGRESMKDVSSKAALDSRSKLFTWVDMDRDGRLDLATWDGATLRLRPVGEDGAMRPAGECPSLKTEAELLGIAPAGMSPGGRARLVLSAGGAPILAEWSSADGWKTSELAKPEGGLPPGKASACIVADLDCDGYVDVLQPREEAGLLWKGGADEFGGPSATGVKCPGGEGVSALGDFDGDGSLDIFLAGAKGAELWENDGKGRFTPVAEYAGSLSYKADYRCSSVAVADLNCDGRQDLALGTSDAGVIYHFNRGFRCLGEEGELRLHEVVGGSDDRVPTLDRWGASAMAIADFSGDGTEDLVTAFAGGEVLCFYNGGIFHELAGVLVSLTKGVTGPVTVSAWQGEAPMVCTGTWPVYGHAPARLFFLRQRGECVLRHSLPGKPDQSAPVEVGENAPLVILK